MCGLLLGLATVRAPAIAAENACQNGPLVQRLTEPLNGFRKVEVPVATQQSTEGGHWEVFFQANGDVHSIIRTDFGETGQRQTRLTFLDNQRFAIDDVEMYYEAPINASRETIIRDRVSTKYFFCDQNAVPSQEAQRLKAVFFESDEIAQFARRR
jgi:hypothetical protein